MVSQGIRRYELARMFSSARTVVHGPEFREHRVYSLVGTVVGYCAGQRAGRPLLSANWTIRLAGSSVIRRLLDRSDLLQVEHPWQVPTLARWNRRRRPLVMVAHNVEALVAAQVGRPAREVEAIRARETDAVAASDAVIAFTDDDRRGLIEHAGADPAKVHVIPLGVDTDRLRPATPEAKVRAKTALGLEGQRVALFVGSLYEPNVQAVAALFDMVSKLDRKDLVFLVVGRVGERFRSNDRVRVTGGVADVATYRAAADLAVNPMRSGGGMQVKLLEFLAAGLPTITTPLGARGLAAVSGRDLVITELDGFAEAIGTCLKDETSAADMGLSGRRLVEDRYAWSAVGRARVALYERLIGKNPTP
jgi:glycosyltransferase involved in cell wall biosynthesis